MYEELGETSLDVEKFFRIVQKNAWRITKSSINILSNQETRKTLSMKSLYTKSFTNQPICVGREGMCEGLT